MANSTIRYSLGESKYDNTPLQCEAETFDAFEDAILANRSPAKGLVYFCSAFDMGEHDDPEKFPAPGHYRSARLAQPKSFLCLDHDGYASPSVFQQLMSDLSKFRGFAYTTWSHTESAPRARVVLQLNREINRVEGIALGEAVDSLLDDVYGVGEISSDKSVHRAEQPCFSPGEDAQVFSFPGKPLDVDQLLSKYGKAKQKITEKSNLPLVPSITETYAKLTPQSLTEVLSKIDPFDEPIWYELSCALARVYGENGLSKFLEFSRGALWSTLYPDFDLGEATAKYERALREVAKRPKGFGMRHLIGLAGLDARQLQFEHNVSEGVPPPSDSSSSQDVQLMMPVKDSRNKPLAVQENLDAVLKNAGVTARYNQIKKRQEIIVPGLQSVSDEALNSAYTTVTDLAIKAGLPATRVGELLDAIASQTPFCPVQTYIKSRDWDGISRYQQFLGQMTTSTPATSYRLWRKWLIQAVAAAFETDGVANAGVMILSGGQGIGKTRLLRDLTSGMPGVFAEGVTLNPADKDSILNSISHWVVELGELEATFRKADIAQLKAFITRQIDTVRRPFARKESNLARRTVFAGTVNDLHCLHDQTGNRRFWPLSVESITFDPTIDYQQLWAEVYNWYQAGEKWYLTPSEQADLEVHCEIFMVADPDVEALLDAYPFQGCTTWEKVTMHEICKNIGIEKPNKGQTMRLAEAIRRYNGGQKPHRSNGLNHHYVPDTKEYVQDTDPGPTNPASAQTPGGDSYATNLDRHMNRRSHTETTQRPTTEQLIAKWKPLSAK